MSLGREGVGGKGAQPQGFDRVEQMKTLSFTVSVVAAGTGGHHSVLLWGWSKSLGVTGQWDPAAAEPPSLSALAAPAAAVEQVPVPFPRDTLCTTAHG